MRPPGGILAPGESLIATGNFFNKLFIENFVHYLYLVSFLFLHYINNIPFQMWCSVFKFVEQPENNEKLSDQKNRVKFKIMSLKVNEGVDYVPELVSLVLLIYVVFDEIQGQGKNRLICAFCWLICEP